MVVLFLALGFSKPARTSYRHNAFIQRSCRSTTEVHKLSQKHPEAVEEEEQQHDCPKQRCYAAHD